MNMVVLKILIAKVVKTFECNVTHCKKKQGLFRDTRSIKRVKPSLNEIEVIV